MFRLGLTGSMATGKSTVLGFFADEGVPVYSADAVVHELYENEAVADVGKAFPDAMAEGKIDRPKLAALLKTHPERLPELEAIVHPLVHNKMHDFLTAQDKAGANLVVLEIPLLFETGKAYPIDAVAVTWCAPDIQKSRALARPGMTVEKFEQLLARQMPQDEKKSRADFLIDTGTTLEQTKKAVVGIIAQCLERGHEQADKSS